jgi:diguanylate cyclase (GGDEF)-like protein/PAS domain S-box-containing protein
MLAAFGVVFAGLIVVLFLVDLNLRYRDAVASAEQQARSYAEVLAQHSARTFEGVDRAMRVAEIVRGDALEHRQTLGPREAASHVHDALRQLAQISPLMVAVGWTDAAGELKAYSYDQVPGRLDIADTPHFIAQRDHPQLGLFVAPPFRSHRNGQWLIAVSRRLTNDDGSFAGIVTAPLDLGYFSNTFRAVDLGPGGAVMLFHRSGAMLAREPAVNGFVGRSFANTQLFLHHLPIAPVGAYEVDGYDGTPRISGYAAVPNLPLVMLVSFSRREVLAAWHRHLYTFGPMVGFVVAVILLGTVLLMRQTRRNADKSRTLSLTLETMAHGLSQYDRNGCLVLCNKRYREIYGLTPDQTKPGTPLREILAQCTANGAGLESADEFIDRRMRALRPGESSLAINHMRDGRIIAVHQQARHGGGWVKIHHDITAEKHTEAELIAKSEQLGQTILRFDAALTNLPVGLCMYDGNQRLIVCNNRYRQMYDLAPDQVRPGTTLRAVLEARVAAGKSPGATQEYIEQRLKEVAEGREYHVVNAMRDGRMVAVTHQPMVGGGWVAIHQDVTPEKRAEAALIAKTQELERANMRFDAALNNMTQGLCMFDSEQRILVANNRFAEIHGLTAEQVRPGTTARQVLEFRVANGVFSEASPEQYIERFGREQSDTQVLANGRVVSIQRQWLPDGSVLTVHEDITDRRQNEAKVAFMAHHDLLTGLANRTLFMEKIQEAGARLRRRGEQFTVFMLDLDRFKDVNDSLGHPAGDALLKEMAERLRSSLRETDVLARLGGDEFAILQAGETNQRDSAIMLAVRIIEITARPFELEGRRVTIGTSIGIALAPQDGVDPDDLIKKADLALYRTKSQGRNGFNFFDAAMTAEADARHELENEMREGIARNEFELFYQLMLDAESREVRGAEALVRWRHPQKGLIPPDRFIPLAEDTGLIVQLGGWILQKACTDAAAWPDHVKVSINLSSMQFRKGDLFDIILCALVESGLPPERLEVEITESVLLENEANYRTLLQQLKNIGVSIVLDDFGTGYSSLGYLTKFPVDKIKIDKSFTQGLIARAECAAVIASVLTLARGLDIATTAEGVETVDQYDMLRAAGVNFVQGYLFCRPCPLSDLRFTPVEIEGQPGDDERASAA